MQLYLIILIFLASMVLARYHEKTRFDRSIHNEYKMKNIEKQWSFTDDVTQFIAYKSRRENDCYLEKLKQDRNVSHKKRQPNVLYASTALTKLEAWQLVGGRIIDFCNGRRIILLQTNKSVLGQTLDPFLNEISVDENDIFPRRIIDVILTPLKARAKRQIQFEREKSDENFNRIRLVRQQTNQFRGKFRGQTQSQYLNLGNHEQKEGKAEAEATQQSSHAVVSGSRGMGQAQSMSSSGPGCEDCPGYPGVERGPERILPTDTDKYVQGLGIGGTPITRPGEITATISYPGRVIPGEQITYPGGMIPGRVGTYPGIPGIYPGGIQPETDKIYPGGVRPETVTPRTDKIYPDGVRPGMVPGSVATYPGGVTPEGAMYPGAVRPGTVTPGVGVTYPTGVRPDTITPEVGATYPRGVQPGIVTPGVGATYPAGVRPDSVTPGVGATYPAGVQPGTVTPGVGAIYPGGVQPGIVTPGVGATYPAGVRPDTVTPGVSATYPAGVQPGTVTPGVGATYPAGVQPGTVTPGVGAIYPGGVQPGTVTPGVGVIYPGGIRPGDDRKYPPGTLVTEDRGLYPGVVQPGRVLPGVTTGAGVEAYPETMYPPGAQLGQGTYPSDGVVTTSITTGATAVTGVKAYPSSITSGKGLPGVVYPGVSETGIYPGTGTYPGGVRPDTVSGIRPDTYPGGIAPGRTIGQGIYPSDGQQRVIYSGGLPSSTLPGQVLTTTGSVGAGTQIITYPGGRTTDRQAIYPGDTIQPSRIPEGVRGAPGTQVTYPVGTYPGSPTIPVTYPGGGTYPGTQQVISPNVTLYPGQVAYPGGVGQVPTYPGGQYPSAGTRIPDGTGVPGGIQYPIGTTEGQTTTGETKTGVTGQYPGLYPGGISGQEIGIDQYPRRPYTGIGETAETGEPSQYYIGSGRPIGVMDNGAESQASSSVQQMESGTQASASAQGKYGSGTAQSQVTGTYSGSGTFSAQAGSSDANKSAQAEISGGKEGATSNAQGIADHGKSQTQVQLDSDSGATSTGAQSSGWNHGTNSQVQASSKGGMADAQANGEGSTSSQAQIGFQPYLKNEDEKMEKNVTPFRGSGTASAQSGTHQGQSQSQLQGSFQYGITYTGAAQAGSGSGAASSRKPFNFTDSELFKPFKPDSSLKKPANVDSAQSSPSANRNDEDTQDDREKGLQSSSTSKQTVVVSSKDNPSNDKKVKATEKSQTDDATYDEYDEYADEDDYSTSSRLTIQEKFSEPLPSSDHQKLKTTQQQSHSQIQTIQIAKGNQYDVHVSQDSNVPQTGDTLQPGQSVSGYTIPTGFRGRVVSTSGTKIIAQGDGKSQSQTVSLVPKDLNNTKLPVTETRSLQTNHERYVGRHTSNNKSQGSFINQNVSSDKRAGSTPAVAMKPSYYTVTNSFTGKINGNNEPRKYEHRYYTKSSTCGYFTFSCNVVYGSNGRTKICKPKVPTYPNGTPMKC